MKKQYGTANWVPGAVFLEDGDKWTSRPARALRAAIRAFRREWRAPVCWTYRSNNTCSVTVTGYSGGGGGSGGYKAKKIDPSTV